LGPRCTCSRWRSVATRSRRVRVFNGGPRQSRLRRCAARVYSAALDT
jgi:hypothetical protein